MKKFLKLSIVLILIMSFAIIIQTGIFFKLFDKKESKKYNSENKRFGAIFMTLNNPFFIQLNEGIKKVVEANGDKLISLDPQLDVNKQISGVNDLIKEKVDGIFLNPVDWKKIRPALEAANKAGIPVFIVDSPVYDDHLVITTVASDNRNAGILTAKHLTQTLGITKGNIVIMEHPTARSAIERTDSFLEEIKKYPDLKIVAKQSSEGQVEKAMPIMQKIIKENPVITAVMAENDPTALGVIAAFESLGKLKKVKAIYGVDGSEAALKMIKTGKLTASVIQYPNEIGKTAAKSAYKYLNGENVPHEIKIPVKLITKENINQF